jgi:hypothetical protein
LKAERPRKKAFSLTRWGTFNIQHRTPNIELVVGEIRLLKFRAFCVVRGFRGRGRFQASFADADLEIGAPRHPRHVKPVTRSPGMVTMLPQTTTIKPAPAESRSSFTLTRNPRGRPRSPGSSESDMAVRKDAFGVEAQFGGYFRDATRGQTFQDGIFVRHNCRNKYINRSGTAI